MVNLVRMFVCNVCTVYSISRLEQVGTWPKGRPDCVPVSVDIVCTCSTQLYAMIGWAVDDLAAYVSTAVRLLNCPVAHAVRGNESIV
jgi:hypothetical protein